MYVFVWSAVLTLSKFLCRFGDEMSDCFPYRAKAMFAFEEIDGVDVCFFGMHVQEYGSNCPMPNTRWVKLTFLWTECMIMWTVRISIFSVCNADCRIGVIVLSSLVIRIRQSCDHVFVCVDCLLTLLDHVIRMCELSAHTIRSCHSSVLIVCSQNQIMSFECVLSADIVRPCGHSENIIFKILFYCSSSSFTLRFPRSWLR